MIERASVESVISLSNEGCHKGAVESFSSINLTDSPPHLAIFLEGAGVAIISMDEETWFCW